MKGVVDTYGEAVVRDKPSVFGDMVCVLKNGTVVEIDEKASNRDFYSICTSAGVEGYCLKMYLMIEE